MQEVKDKMNYKLLYERVQQIKRYLEIYEHEIWAGQGADKHYANLKKILLRGLRVD